MKNEDQIYIDYKSKMAMYISMIILCTINAILMLPYALGNTLISIGMATFVIIMATLEYKNPKNKQIRNMYKHAKSLGFDSIQEWKDDIEMGYIQ